MKKLLCIAAFLLGLLPSLAFSQYAALPTTGTLSGLQAVTDINTNFASIYGAAPCGSSTTALGATATGFFCQTLSTGGSTLAVTTSNVSYSGVMAAVTSGSLSTVYSAAGYTYNPSTKVFNLPSGATYEINSTQIALSNLSNGTTGTGTTVVLNAAPTISGTLTLSSLTTGIAEQNGSGAVSSFAYGSSGTYLESLGTSTTWATPGGSGTVTTVSVATANGFSGTVANASTTPAITIIAGAINPTSLGMTSTTATAPVNGIYSSVANELDLTTSSNKGLQITSTGNVPEVYTSGAFVSGPNALTISTTTFTPVAVSSNTYRVVLTSACPCLIANPSGAAADGQRFIVEIWQPAASATKTVTYGNLYDFGTAGSPTLSTTTGAGDFIGFSYSAENSKYNYIGVQQGF